VRSKEPRNPRLTPSTAKSGHAPPGLRAPRPPGKELRPSDLEVHALYSI
jgi:hypothetical protein